MLLQSEALVESIYPHFQRRHTIKKSCKRRIQAVWQSYQGADLATLREKYGATGGGGASTRVKNGSV